MSRAAQTAVRNAKRNETARRLAESCDLTLHASIPKDDNRFVIQGDDGTWYTVVVSRQRGQ